MSIGIRRAAIASALPIVAVTLAATAWAGWYSQDGRSELARLGQQATLSASTTEALTGLSQEVIALHGLGALTRPIPASLRPYLASADVVNRAQPGGAAEQLDRADRIGARALERLLGAGQPLRPGTRRALAPLTPADHARAVAGDPPGGASTEDYADAVTDMQAAFASAPGRTQDAVDRLVEVGASPPPWRDPAFLGALVGVWSLAVVAAAAIGRQVGRALRRVGDERDAERERAGELVRRNERLLELGDASRRVSARTDLRGVSDAVAAEAAALLGAGVAVVYLVEGADAVPAGVAGAIGPATIAADAGVLGRALDTGAPARGVADGDPALPGLSPVAALAAPLIAGRQVIGGIVVGREADSLPDDDDALALRLIALTAATAIEGARARDSATTLALTDPLTGLGNRRRLDDDLARECGPGGRRPVAFVMIDVDHFKSFNDTHGHMAGDDVLRAIAGITASCVREDDVVYRFGGEELCILLPGAGDGEALAVAERVRATVAARAFPGGESQPGGRVTVSAGVARADDPEAAALVAAADAALYRAKRAGRDRVVAAG